MSFKSVSLPTDIWTKVIRRLTAEVGADDESRKWADLIKEQTSGAVTVSTSSGGSMVRLKAPKGGDLRESNLLR